MPELFSEILGQEEDPIAAKARRDLERFKQQKALPELPSRGLEPTPTGYFNPEAPPIEEAPEEVPPLEQPDPIAEKAKNDAALYKAQAKVMSPEHSGFWDILKDTLVGTGKDILETGVGTLEAGATLATGIPSWLSGITAQGISSLYDVWKSGGQLGLEEAVAQRVPTKERFMEATTFQPQTEFGETVAQIATSPFESAFEVVDFAAENLGVEEKDLPFVRFLAELGMVAIPGVKKAAKALPATMAAAKLRDVAGRTKATAKKLATLKKETIRQSREVLKPLKREAEKVEAPGEASDRWIGLEEKARTEGLTPDEFLEQAALEGKFPKKAPRVVPEQEIRVSRDKATGETVIKIPERRKTPPEGVIPEEFPEAPGKLEVKKAKPEPIGRDTPESRWVDENIGEQIEKFNIPPIQQGAYWKEARENLRQLSDKTLEQSMEAFTRSSGRWKRFQERGEPVKKIKGEEVTPIPEKAFADISEKGIPREAQPGEKGLEPTPSKAPLPEEILETKTIEGEIQEAITKAKLSEREAVILEEWMEGYKELKTTTKELSMQDIADRVKERTGEEISGESARVIVNKVQKQVGETIESARAERLKVADKSEKPAISKKIEALPEKKLTPGRKVSAVEESINKRIREMVEGKRTHRPIKLQKEALESGTYVSDEVMIKAEQAYVDRRLSAKRKTPIDIAKEVEVLKKNGVRPEIISKFKLNARYPLETLVSVKTGVEGKVGSVITKKGMAHIKKVFKGKIPKGWAKWYSPEALGQQVGKFIGGFDIPQLVFKRMGLGHLYDQLRVGEHRRQSLLRNKYIPQIDEAFSGLGGVKNWKQKKQWRQELSYFFDALQGKKEEMKKLGIKIPKWEDLNDAQKKAAAGWKRINKQYGSKVKEVAATQGQDITLGQAYAPFYTKKGVRQLGKVTQPGGMTETPFWQSLLSRGPEGVPYKMLEPDFYKRVRAWGEGMANFTEVGPKSFALKHLLDSEGFKDIVGPKMHKYIEDWHSHAIHPKAGPKVLSFARKRAYQSLLGLPNLKVPLKQFGSYIDGVFLHKMSFNITPRVKRILKQLERHSSVTERVADVGLIDMNTKQNRAFMGGLIFLDKGVAQGVMKRILATELMKMEKEGIKLTSKSLRQATYRASKKLDLTAGGTTLAQIPPFYRTEMGKLALMFSSTINSRLHAYVDAAVKGITAGDKKALVKIATGAILAAYYEAAVTKGAFIWDDVLEVVKDTGKVFVGNIPTLGAIQYGLDVGDWSASPVFQTFEDVIGILGKIGRKEAPIEQGLWAVGEAFGLPRQIRKDIKGAKTIKEGKRVSKSEYIAIDTFDEKLRAIFMGEYGPTGVQRHLKGRRRKAQYRKRIDDIYTKARKEDRDLTEIEERQVDGINKRLRKLEGIEEEE